ncbi:MAG: hypothetical protein ABI307_11180 [Mycobacterium sp.]
MQGHQSFADELTRLAAELPDPRVAVIAARVAAPLRVAVCGRRGVGRRTVAAALRGAGVAVSTRPGAEMVADMVADMVGDVVAYVVAEVAKPEDTAAVAALDKPVLVVLNKADLPGGAGPAEVSALVGASAEPMAGLLAVAAFTGFGGPFGGRLDGTAEQARALLRRLSGVDTVVGRLVALGAAVRYRRISEAVAELDALAVGAARIGEFLADDAVVAARMAAAVAVVEAAGLSAGLTGNPDAELRRAARWQHYSAAPVTALHRACGADIARGSLRIWSRTGEPE